MMITLNSSAEFEKWRLNKRRKSVNFRNLLCRRTLFRILYIVIAGIGISFHTFLENGIGRSFIDWTITPGCFVSDIMISMVQIISIVYGMKKDKMDGFYNAFLMILYAIGLDSLMNALTPDDYNTFAWYRIIAESIASAVAFLLHFFEIISTWIESELGMEPTYVMNQSRTPVNSSLHTRAGRMRMSRCTQTVNFKEDVSLHNHSLANKPLDAIEVSNPTLQDRSEISSSYSFKNDSHWIRETVLVELFPWNNDEK